MKTSLAILFLLLAAVGAREPFACDPSDAATKTLPFCRADLRTEERIRDLIGRLKVKLLGNNAAAVPRLGIKGYEWWSEALHGVSNVGPGTRFGGDFPGATSFPQVINTAASFNGRDRKSCVRRGPSDVQRRRGGLDVLEPEREHIAGPEVGAGAGDSPLVAGEYAARYVRGLQGTEGGDRLKVAACCKHYTAYDLDNWSGVDRFHFNAKCAFKAAFS